MTLKSPYYKKVGLKTTSPTEKQQTNQPSNAFN